MLALIAAAVTHAAAPVREPRYTYREFDSIVTFYETKQADVYRQLLPDALGMPDRLLVRSFIADFYSMDARTRPYKEGAVFLLAKHEGRDVWHCITMPVTSDEARRLGVRILGFPKVMGDIDLHRGASVYSGSVGLPRGQRMAIRVETKDYEASAQEEKQFERLWRLPQVNMLRGRAVQLGGAKPGQKSLIELAKLYPNKVTVKFGRGAIDLNPGRPIDHEPNAAATSRPPHPFDLGPSRIVLAYYVKSTFAFHLRGWTPK